MINQRSFGVEIECQSPGLWGCDGVANFLEENGFPEWAENVYPDGSEVEIPSPILSGAKGMNDLKAVMNLLKKNGFTVTSYDGMHVHHDTEDLTMKQIYVIASSWRANQHLINRFVNPERRNGRWCRDLSLYDLDAIESAIEEKERKSWDSLSESDQYNYCCEDCYEYNSDNDDERFEKYKSLSLANRSYSGTIEIRLHEGTLDFEKAKAWILFGQAFISNVAKKKKPLPRFNNPLDLLVNTKTYKVAQKKLLSTTY